MKKNQKEQVGGQKKQFGNKKKKKGVSTNEEKTEAEKEADM